MCKKDEKYLFLERVVLTQSTNLENPSSVIDKCISLAYKDMLTRGRHCLDTDLEKGSKEKTKLNSNRKDVLKTIIERHNYKYDREIINEFIDKTKNFGEKLSYGLAQKVVNMTFKYLYTFSEYTKLKIDFSNCDCPIDSHILKKLELAEKYDWSTLKRKDYTNLQKIIKGKIKNDPLYKKLGKLAYDFKYW